MPSTNNVQNTHNPGRMRDLHAALVDIVVMMNLPQRDQYLLDMAGVPLDRALFPLLVGIGRGEPIGVVDLADRVGRDHSTVSRQVAKLESLGLVERRAGQPDRRVREALLTETGRAMIARIDAARERIGRTALAGWTDAEIDNLVATMRRFADAFTAAVPG